VERSGGEGMRRRSKIRHRRRRNNRGEGSSRGGERGGGRGVGEEYRRMSSLHRGVNVIHVSLLGGMSVR